MKHPERWSLAEGIARKVAENHNGKVSFVAAAGSTAEGKDGDFSDLDIVIASKEKIGTSRKFIYKDIIAEPFYITRKEAEEIFRDPSNEEWQSWMMLIHTAKVVWGDEKVLKEMQSFDSSIPSEDYARPAARNLILIQEFINHEKAVLPYNSLPDMLYFSVAVRKLAIDFVALINKKYYLSYDWIGEAKSFSHLPNDYVQLATKLGSSTSGREILDVSSQLLDSCKAKAHQLGIMEETHQSVETVKV
jgi:predicted nucleotidyltransferase